jgi:hypothetical protein
MKVGSISKARCSVTPDDVKVSTNCNNHYLQCFASNMTMTTAAGAVTLDNALVISQLTNAISVQNEETTESAAWKLKGKFYREYKKKDQTKKIHPAIIKMLWPAVATHENEETQEISPTCIRFVNAEKCWISTVLANSSV